MPSPAMPDGASESSLIVHRLNAMDQRIERMDERLDRVETTLGGLCVSVGKTDTKINIVLGILGAIGSGASFLLVRLLMS